MNFYLVLNKNWNIYWSEQSFTDLGPVLTMMTGVIQAPLSLWFPFVLVIFH